MKTIAQLSVAVVAAARAVDAANAACHKAGAEGGYWAPAAERAALAAAENDLETAKAAYAKQHAETTEAHWTTFEERDRAGREAATGIARAVAGWL